VTDNTQNPADLDHDERRDELDNFLDATLAKYAVVAPRIGLEERVLANLRSEMMRASTTASWRWWPWAAAGVAAGIYVVVLIAWRPGNPSHPAIAHRPSIATPAIRPGTEEPVTEVAQGSADSPHVRAYPASRHRNPIPALASAGAKLDVFPSPLPLSEQEKILANYVAQFHDQAVFIARVTNEELKHDRIEVLGSSENPDEVANQQTTNR